MFVEHYIISHEYFTISPFRSLRILSIFYWRHHPNLIEFSLKMNASEHPIYMIDLHGRIWESTIHAMRANENDVDPNEFKLSDHPIVKPRNYVKLLSYNIRVGYTRTNTSGKVVTREGMLYSIDGRCILDERPIFVEVAEMRDGSYYTLDVYGILRYNDEVIMKNVQFLKSHDTGIVIRTEAGWLCNTRYDKNLRSIEGNQPSGQLIVRRSMIILTDEGLYRLINQGHIIRSIKLDTSQIEHPIIDVALVNHAAILTDNGEIFYHSYNRMLNKYAWRSMNEYIVKTIHENSKIINLYHRYVLSSYSRSLLKTDDLLFTTSLGETFKYSKTINEDSRFPKELMRKPLTNMKSAKSRLI
jgi:hypothetical protein